MYRFSSERRPLEPTAVLSVRRFLTVRTCLRATPIEKFR
jgi:hypothetical protein